MLARRFAAGSGAPLRAIVLAGGRGRRLEAYTIAHFGAPIPKQYCDFGEGRTLLQATLDRIGPIVPPDRTVVVVDAAHVALAAAQTRAYPGLRLVAQPCDRGTAAGVLLPLVEALRDDPAATLLVTPSDHAFSSESLFRAGVRRARAAVDSGAARVVLFGAASGEPSTDFGWIVTDAPARSGLRKVLEFVEKPGPETAATLHARGALCNTMVLLAWGPALLALYRTLLPDLAAALAALAGLPPGLREEALARRYPTIRQADFSRDLLGRATGLHAYAWPAEAGWTDLGSTERLEAWLRGRVAAPAYEAGAERVTG